MAQDKYQYLVEKVTSLMLKKLSKWWLPDFIFKYNLICLFHSSPTQDLNVDEFEEIFKTKAQGPAIDLSSSKQKITQKGSNKVTLLEANRAKNLAITLRKAGKTADEICKAIHV